MRKRLFVLTCVLGMAMLTACGATETAHNVMTENQVVESVAAEAAKDSAETIAEATEEVTEERVEVGTEATGESAESETVESEEVAEESAESETEVSTEVTEENAEPEAEASEEVMEESTEVVQEEMSEEDAMAAIQEILAQAQKEALERAEAEATPPKEYDFPEGYDSNKYTWRQTTADRNLYFLESDKALVGKEFIGETFEEILQMAEDPTCDFDEANFWNATCFKGLTIKDTEYLVSKGYNVDQLINMIIENGVGNVYELSIW